MDAARSLSAGERLDWLRLWRSENVGPVTFRRLLGRYGSARVALDILPEIARRGGRTRPIRLCPPEAAEHEIAAIERLGARLVGWDEADYPPLLRHVDDAPPLLCLLGNPGVLRTPAVGVVGSRNASINGKRLAATLAADLGAAGWSVVSGLARGIDTAAHEGSLATGTAAVLAGGVDVVYPPENRGLYDRIREQGLFLCESPPGTEPLARHFPRRNRLISGSALGVVVVEARPGSGSLITARTALEQGREVFAVPGSPLDPRAHGGNHLIRQGATLTESVDDVLRVLEAMRTAPEKAAERPPPFLADSALPADFEAESAQTRIVAALGPAPVAVDEVIRSCQFSPAIVSSVLLELELAGRLERHPGNRVSLIHLA